MSNSGPNDRTHQSEIESQNSLLNSTQVGSNMLSFSAANPSHSSETKKAAAIRISDIFLNDELFSTFTKIFMDTMSKVVESHLVAGLPEESKKHVYSQIKDVVSNALTQAGFKEKFLSLILKHFAEDEMQAICSYHALRKSKNLGKSVLVSLQQFEQLAAELLVKNEHFAQQMLVAIHQEQAEPKFNLTEVLARKEEADRLAKKPKVQSQLEETKLPSESKKTAVIQLCDLLIDEDFCKTAANSLIKNLSTQGIVVAKENEAKLQLKLSEIVSKALSQEVFKKEFLDLIINQFEEDEIVADLSFHGSPVGKKALPKLALFAVEFEKLIVDSIDSEEKIHLLFQAAYEEAFPEEYLNLPYLVKLTCENQRQAEMKKLSPTPTAAQTKAVAFALAKGIALLAQKYSSAIRPAPTSTSTPATEAVEEPCSPQETSDTTEENTSKRKRPGI